MSAIELREDYWENFTLLPEDTEFLYNHLLEHETPLTTAELVDLLVHERIRREKLALQQKRSASGKVYKPADTYQVSQRVVFPTLAWRSGEVVEVRPGRNPDLGAFEVIRVAFEDGELHEYAASLAQHTLNDPQEIAEAEISMDPAQVLEEYRDQLVENLDEDLETRDDFVRIAGRWFPRALLVDINIGHLNLAEAVLDMTGGGPLNTSDLLAQIGGISSNVNAKLVEFSMDLALQEDERFDEVGASGQVLWFLRRLEPEQVLEPPVFLRYPGVEYDRSLMTREMLALEQELDDELSPLGGKYTQDEVQVRLIFSHWRAGTLPLSSKLRHLFPTAYEAPRIRFTLVDGETGENIPAWVVRPKRYVYGLSEWYRKNNLQPGSMIRVQRGQRPGEVIIHSGSRRPSREWIRTVLVGSDGGVVFAMLKQSVHSQFDERMTIAIPDPEAVDQVWSQMSKDRTPLENVVVNLARELAKLNPQGHVHAIELYAALNVVRRCPPGPMLAMLASRPGVVHVGDLHFRFGEGGSG